MPSSKEHVFLRVPAFLGVACLIMGGLAIHANYADGWWGVVAGATLLAVVIMVVISAPKGYALSAGLVAVVAGLFWQLQRYGIPGAQYAWIMIAAGVLTLAITVWVLTRKQTGSQGKVRDESKKLRRQDGVASKWQLFKTGSAFMLRLRAKVLRPALRLLPSWRRLLVPATELGTPLARVGVQNVWSSVEDVTLVVGGPRKGKSGMLGCRILDASGAVIATSTRVDLIDLTAGVRRRQKGPTYVFNPCGLGGLESTVTFDPLSGCEDFATAKRRASDMVGAGPTGGDGGEREYWLTQAARALSVMMHAAKLSGSSMFDVQRWMAAPDTYRDAVIAVLEQSTAEAAEGEARQFFETNPNTRSSITSTVSPVLEWLASPTAVAAAEPGRTLDVERLLVERGTIYMLAEEDGLVAPLVTALTAHLAREARRIAGNMPKGRLDPPLTLVLDEAAIICPIPLDRWTADMGGRNITIHIAVQGRTQLRERWGNTGAGTIMNNAANLMIMGGAFDEDDLKAYVLLIGDRDEETDSVNHTERSRSTSLRRDPIMGASQLASMPKGEVVLVRSESPPVVGRTQMVWKRRAVKKWNRNMDRFERARAKEARRLETATGSTGLVQVSFRDGWAGFRAWLVDLRTRIATPPPVDPTMRTRRIGDTPTSPVDYSEDSYPFPTEERRHLVVVPPADDEQEDQR